jgi:hypothetical protein
MVYNEQDKKCNKRITITKKKFQLSFGKSMDANISIELCAAQKVRQQKVEKYLAKQMANGTFLFEKKVEKMSENNFVVGGKDSCQVRCLFEQKKLS